MVPFNKRNSSYIWFICKICVFGLSKAHAWVATRVLKWIKLFMKSSSSIHYYTPWARSLIKWTKLKLKLKFEAWWGNKTCLKKVKYGSICLWMLKIIRSLINLSNFKEKIVKENAFFHVAVPFSPPPPSLNVDQAMIVWLLWSVGQMMIV